MIIPQIAKIYGPQIANQEIATFAEGSPIYKRMKSANLRICDLRNLFADATLGAGIDSYQFLRIDSWAPVKIMIYCT